MRRFKLVKHDYTTHNQTAWRSADREWLEIKAPQPGNRLCSPQVIHFYDHPLVAVFANPIHANITKARLLEIEIDQEVAHDGLKGGCKTAIAIRELVLPSLSHTQRVSVAILLTRQFHKNADWNLWATNWLKNIDRTSKPAHAAAYAADADAAAAAAAAAYAADDAADADAAAYAAASAAAVAAAYAADADAAAYAADADAAAAAAAAAAAYAAASAAAAAAMAQFRKDLIEILERL